MDVCEFHGSSDNGFGYIWWTDNPIYFSSIDVIASLFMLWRQSGNIISHKLCHSM